MLCLAASRESSVGMNSYRPSKSDLFAAKTSGTLSTTLNKAGIQYRSRLSKVSRLVRSATRRAPWTPANVRAWEAVYPSRPRTSQIMKVRSTVFSGRSIVNSFLVTLLPIVAMYVSSKTSSTNRLMRLVLPTALSPRRTTFFFTPITRHLPSLWGLAASRPILTRRPAPPRRVALLAAAASVPASAPPARSEARPSEVGSETNASRPDFLKRAARLVQLQRKLQILKNLHCRLEMRPCLGDIASPHPQPTKFVVGPAQVVKSPHFPQL